jgi:hypothetical protein
LKVAPFHTHALYVAYRIYHPGGPNVADGLMQQSICFTRETIIAAIDA